MWEGLGYYSRARNLKKTAQIIIKNFKGKLPSNFEDLTKLPGVGNYTANAILAIAFNKQHIPLDGNIERVMKRMKRMREGNKRRENRIVKDMNKITLVIVGRPRSESNNKEGIGRHGVISLIPSPEFTAYVTNNIINNLITIH